MWHPEELLRNCRFWVQGLRLIGVHTLNAEEIPSPSEMSSSSFLPKHLLKAQFIVILLFEETKEGEKGTREKPSETYMTSQLGMEILSIKSHQECTVGFYCMLWVALFWDEWLWKWTHPVSVLHLPWSSQQEMVSPCSQEHFWSLMTLTLSCVLIFLFRSSFLLGDSCYRQEALWSVGCILPGLLASI